MVKAKLLKQRFSPFPAHLLTKTQIDQDCLVPVHNLWLGCVDSPGGAEHRAMTALGAVLGAQGVTTNHVTPRPVHLHSEEVRELQGGSSPGCLAWQWGRLFPTACLGELVLFPAGWKRSQQPGPRMFIRGAGEDLAVLWWPLCWICFAGKLWGERLLRGVWGCGKEEKWWCFGYVSCWMLCGNFMKYVKVRIGAAVV